MSPAAVQAYKDGGWNPTILRKFFLCFWFVLKALPLVFRCLLLYLVLVAAFCFLYSAFCFPSAPFSFLLFVDYTLLPARCFQPFCCLLLPFCFLFAVVFFLDFFRAHRLPEPLVFRIQSEMPPTNTRSANLLVARRSCGRWGWMHRDPAPTQPPSLGVCFCWQRLLS